MPGTLFGVRGAFLPLWEVVPSSKGRRVALPPLGRRPLLPLELPPLVHSPLPGLEPLLA